MIAARQVAFGGSNQNKEEEMYKELYESMVNRSIVNAIGNDVDAVGKNAFKNCFTRKKGSTRDIY
jgi:hypothetical protein